MAAIKKEGETIKEEANKTSLLLEDLVSLEHYASDLFTFLPLPVCLVSAIGIILDANPAFEEISGHKIDEIIGKSAEEIFDKAGIGKLSKQTLEKGFTKGEEISILTKDKKEIPGSASATLRKTEEGEVVGYFLGFFDLTNIKKRENELREVQVALSNILEDVEGERRRAESERNKTLAIIENFSDGLIVFDNQGKVALINPKAEEAFGVKEKEILGIGLSEFAKNPSLFSLADIFKGEIKKISRKELAFSENLVLEISAIKVIEEGREKGFLVIAHDITREKTVERMKSEFVSIAAHQLRTPLAAIKWTLRMLLDGDVGHLDSKQKDMLEKTYVSNERMIHLINDLLDVTRIEEGRHVYKLALIDLEPIVQPLFEAYKGEAEKKKIRLEFKKPLYKLPEILLDAEKIKLAIQNLIENALRYTLPRGRVTISLKSDKKEVELSVTDTGIGIPKDQQQRIFTKFFRSENAVRMETEGSGLGLFITKNIVEAHKGRIWFESEENKGTVFHFSIPVPKEFEEFLKGF